METVFLEEIQNSEMVLVGLGEEFDQRKALLNCEGYQETEEMLKNAGLECFLPRLQYLFRKKNHIDIMTPLKNLQKLLCDKNYYIIATSTAYEITEIDWKHGFFVYPFGNAMKIQCNEDCKEEPREITQEELHKLDNVLENLIENRTIFEDDLWGKCPKCGRKQSLNSIYQYENYDERGYKEKWDLYSKWLQGTLNRKLLLLELGVSLDSPQVIRWPFEKVSEINKKGTLYRVNKNFYQLPENLKEIGISVSENAIDWLIGL